MKNKLLNKAALLELNIYQEVSGKWTIKSCEKNRNWSLEEKEEDKWLIILNKVPQMMIQTEIAIDMMEILNNM